MKKLFMTVFIIGIILLGIPLIMLSLMYESDATSLMPLELYTEEADGFSLLYAQLATGLEAAQDEGSAALHVLFDETILNTLIFNYIRGDGPFKEAINPDYMPGPDCKTASCAVIVETATSVGGRRFMVQLEGLWVRFVEDTLYVHAALVFNYQDRSTFKTVVRTELSLEEDAENGVWTLVYQGANLGHVPILGVLTQTAMTLFDRVTSYDFDEAVDMASQAIQVNRQPLNITIDLPALIEQATATLDDDVGAELALTLIDALLEEALLKFAFTEEGINMHVQLDALRIPNTTTLPDILIKQQDAAGFNPHAFSVTSTFKNHLETWLIGRALGGSEPLHIHADTMSAALFHEAGGFERFQYEFDYRDETGSPSILFMGLEALWLEFDYDDTETPKGAMTVYGLFNFGGLKTRLALRSEQVETDHAKRLKFALNAVTIGDLSTSPLRLTDVARFEKVFDSIAIMPFIQVDAAQQHIIDGDALLNEMGQTDVWTIETMTLTDRGLVLNVNPQNAALQETLDMMIAAIHDVLSTGISGELNALFGDETESQAFIGHLMTIETVLSEGGVVDQADITKLMTQLDALSESTRQQFTDTLSAHLDPAIQAQFDEAFLE